VRRHLGWAEEQCVDPPDAFGACFSDRLKPDMRTHDAAIRSTEEFVLEDWTEYREQILSLVGFWHALVLAGYDPNALFRSATKKAGWRHKLIVRGVLWTTPLPGWSNWGYEIERDAVGRVNIFTTGL